MLPVALYRTDRSWRLAWWVRFKMPGGVVCCPVGERHFRIRVFFLTAAGPFASLLSSGAFGWLAANLDSTWLHSLTGWFSATALFSFWFGLGNLLPVNTPLGPSDGLWMWMAARRSKDADRQLAFWLLRASSIGGLRPREWSPALVKLALLGSGPDALSKTFEYNWYADTKQFTEAAAAVEWWLHQSMPRETRAIWWHEAAWFEAFSMSNLPTALERLTVAESLGGGKLVECSAWKARAAIAACDGRYADALSAADRANQAVSLLILDAGLAKGIRGDLLELIARVQAELRKKAGLA